MANVDLLFFCHLSTLEASFWELGSISIAKYESEYKIFTILYLGLLKWSPGRLGCNNSFFQEVPALNNQFWVSYKLIYSHQVYFTQR